MLFKISLSNIRKSLRDYTVYFFTLIIGVSVFYVFNAIETQTSFMKVSEDTREIIDLLKTLLSGVSVFVSIVLGLLIVYASRFLMKRRSKEFALYLTLGMGKGKISAILLFETVIIGIISLAIGLITGIGLSQLMSAFVANLFEADMTDYRFTVSIGGIGKTLLYFGIIYLAVMIFNSFIIGKFKLIDLIQSGKKSEKLKLKNPVLCVIVFLISAAALGYAYYQVGWNSEKLNSKSLITMIAIGSVTTFLIFWSVSGMILRIVMSMKNVYFRSLNSFTFRQISSKINTMVMSMTVICLMLFVTICTLSSAFTIRNSMNANLNELCPADFEMDLRNGEQPNISTLCDEAEINLNAYFNQYVHFYDYCDESFTFEKSMGSQLETLKTNYPYLIFETPETIVKLSDYNKLMELYGREPFTLNDDEYILICNFRKLKEIRDEALKQEESINVFGNTLKSKYSECQDGFVDLSSQRINDGIFIIPDSAADEKCINIDHFIGNYAAQDKDEKAKIESQLLKEIKKLDSINENSENAFSYNVNTKNDIANASIGLGAIVTFLGLYIGIVFLISCGAILALKELSENVDSIPRYEMLRKIGVEEKDISKSLFRQTGIFFLIPLILAGIHSVFGMKFALYVIEILGTDRRTSSVIFSSLIILIIYGGYFLITYFCGKGIIKNKK